jgi:hypothetical protein
MERRALKFCRESEVHCRRAEDRRQAEAWKIRPRGAGHQEVSRDQVHHGWCDRHVDGIAGKPCRS